MCAKSKNGSNEPNNLASYTKKKNPSPRSSVKKKKSQNIGCLHSVLGMNMNNGSVLK